MKGGKKQKVVRGKINTARKYTIDEALAFIKEGATAKYDETLDAAIRLGIDPKQGDQQVRGAVVLPHGLGTTTRVVVFAKGAKEAEAKEAGADFVGGDDLVQKIQGGWMEFDSVIATPDMMGVVSKVGKLLGPRGLMPNPKLGTVTMDVKKAVSDCKAGKSEFRNEKAGIVQASFGKISFGPEKLKDNLKTLLETIQRLKPNTAKGIYVKGLSLSSTIGPGVRIDLAEWSKMVA